MTTILLVLVLVFVLGAIGGAIFLLKLDQSKIDRVRNWVMSNGSSIITAVFLLVVGILIFIFNIRWTDWGFIAAVGGILIWFLYSVKKGKETNWWLLSSLVIALGVGFYLFHKPVVTKEGVVEKEAGSLYEKAKEKGYAKALLSEAKDQLWKSPPKPAPHVPTFQLIDSGKFVGKGFEQAAEISTDWRTSNILRKDDEIHYEFPKDASLEVLNSKGDRVRYRGPRQTLYFSTEAGEVTFWLSKGATAYIELKGIR